MSTNLLQKLLWRPNNGTYLSWKLRAYKWPYNSFQPPLEELSNAAYSLQEKDTQYKQQNF